MVVPHPNLYILHDFVTKFAGNFFDFPNLHGILSIFHELPGNYFEKHQEAKFPEHFEHFHEFPGNFFEKLFYLELFHKDVKNILPWYKLGGIVLPSLIPLPSTVLKKKLANLKKNFGNE